MSEPPFVRLLYGAEPKENTVRRYERFQEIHERQSDLIKHILSDMSELTSQQIDSVIKTPISGNLDTCMLLSKSGFATSAVFLEQMKKYLEANESYKVITLNSKETTTMRLALKQLVNGITGEVSMESVNDQNDEEDDDNDDDNDNEDDEEIKTFDKRHPWDLDIVEQWCQLHWQKTGTTIDDSDLRIVLILEDIESFELNLLNKFLILLHSYASALPLKLIFNIGNNVQSFAQKLSSEVSHMLSIHKLSIEQTDHIINRVVSDIIIPQDLMIGEELAKFILDRFKFSIKNVDELIKILTFSEMIHFFANELSLLPFLEESEILQLHSDYFESLRQLPSFKRYINMMVLKKLPNDKILPLVHDNAATAAAFIKASRVYSNFVQTFRSIFKLLTEVLAQRSFKSEKNHMEYYFKLVIKDDFIRVQFINELLLLLGSISAEDLKEMMQEIEHLAQEDDFIHGLSFSLKQQVDITILDEFQGDNFADKTNYKIEAKKLIDRFTSTLGEFLKSKITRSDKIIFNEVFMLNDVDVVRLNLVPAIKDMRLDSLIYPENRLGDSKTGHEVIDRLNGLVKPVLTQMFSLYRETMLDLNIYDYYSAFKYSLRKDEIMRDINLILDDKDKVFESYLNDDLRFKYIYQFFNDTTLSEDEKWDRFTLALFLQKAEELVYCGFFKQRSHANKKAGSLEKALWKDV
jgi:origin recognition complex subunit 3